MIKGQQQNNKYFEFLKNCSHCSGYCCGATFQCSGSAATIQRVAQKRPIQLERVAVAPLYFKEALSSSTYQVRRKLIMYSVVTGYVKHFNVYCFTVLLSNSDPVLLCNCLGSMQSLSCKCSCCEKIRVMISEYIQFRLNFQVTRRIV